MEEFISIGTQIHIKSAGDAGKGVGAVYSTGCPGKAQGASRAFVVHPFALHKRVELLQSKPRLVNSQQNLRLVPTGSVHEPVPLD